MAASPGTSAGSAINSCVWALAGPIKAQEVRKISDLFYILILAGWPALGIPLALSGAGWSVF
jgi:hypothetical protein